MAKFNTRRTRTQAYSPVRSTGRVGITYEGAPGYARDPKSELFLLAASNFMSADAFYESMADRDNRLLQLTQQVAVQDPLWLLRMVRWLRGPGNLRTVALVLGLEGARAALGAGDDWKGTEIIQHGQGIARLLAKAGIGRADEPGEAMAYWFSHYGRAMPMPIKRAIGDMATALYNQYTLLKYDTGSHGFRFADVIMLTHAKPSTPWQEKLFKYALERRYGAAPGIPVELGMVAQNARIRATAADNLDILFSPQALSDAGMNWEDVLSLAGGRVSKKDLWQALIPAMGYMALLRNLRNFDQAGVSDEVAARVADRLSDRNQVARSRQLPFRFINAWDNVPSLRWAWPLEQALNHCLSNVPSLGGRTLILVDTSTSMDKRFSDRGSMTQMKAAALFGIALASRAADATLVSFASRVKLFPLQPAESVLSAWKRWEREYFLHGGTATASALRSYYSGHDRVIIVTDEQARRDATDREVTNAVPAWVPMHTINLVGYSRGMAPSGKDNRHAYGGLSDAMFKLIPLVEQGVSARWPWE